MASKFAEVSRTGDFLCLHCGLKFNTEGGTVAVPWSCGPGRDQAHVKATGMFQLQMGVDEIQDEMSRFFCPRVSS